MRSYLYRSTVLLTALAGCPTPGDDTTAGDTTSGSTSGGSTGPAPTTGAASTTDDPTGAVPFDGVIGPVVRTYLPLSSPPLDVAQDPLPEYDEIAIVVGAGADAQTFPATYDGSSRLEFAGVPEVTYLLRRKYISDVTYLLETAARELGVFGGIYSGRPDVAFSSEYSTAVAITASGLPPLGPDDFFTLYSYNADARELAYPSLNPLDDTNSPALGATELAGWTLPWFPFSTRAGWPLVDPTQGDDLWLGYFASRQLVPDPSGPEAIDAWSFADLAALRHAASMNLQPMIDGATAALTGKFEPTAEKQVTVDLRATNFRSELETLAPFSYSVSCFLYVVLEPGTEHPVYGQIPYLGWARVFSRNLPVDPMCPPDNCDPDLCAACDTVYAWPGDRVVDMTYGNPYPGGTEMLTARCRLREYLTHPGAPVEETVDAVLEVSGKLADMTAAPIVPKLGLIGDLRFNGAPSTTSQVMKVSLTPTISFAPPAFGTPDKYVVSIMQLEAADPNKTELDQYLIATYTTTGTSVTLPEGVLQPGSYYYVLVDALRGSKPNTSIYDTFDQQRSTTYSGFFTP